jgi:hypothetical protein
MAKRKKAPKTREKPLDRVWGKRRRGRPGVRPSEIRGRGDHYRLVFSQIWKVVGEALLKARTEEDVNRAFDPSSNYKQEFAPLASLILQVLRDPKFPKRPEPQRNFPADSLAGRGLISPRRSRDICEQERKKKVHFIIRQDYYIECTCRYKGPALHGKCPKCGTDRLSLPVPTWGRPDSNGDIRNVRT